MNVINVRATFFLLFALGLFSPGHTFAQETNDSPVSHSIVGSPFSLMSKLRYEKITKTHFTLGARVEYFFSYASIGVLPNARLYFFNNEATGLYTEAAVGVMKYPTTGEYALDDVSQDSYPWSIQGRLGIGLQFFAGKNNNVPVDFSLAVNADTWYLAWASDLANDGDELGAGAALAGLAGPWSLFKIRFQTGIAW